MRVKALPQPKRFSFLGKPPNLSYCMVINALDGVLIPTARIVPNEKRAARGSHNKLVISGKYIY